MNTKVESPFKDMEEEDWPLKDQYLQPTAAVERLYREYKKHGSLVIGFDFDGTVHDYHKTGGTYEEVRQLLRDLKEIGCKCICWTCYHNHSYVKDFCYLNNIPCDGINCDGIPLPWECRKPFFSAILDDRGGLMQVYAELRALVDQIKIEEGENES